MKRITRALLLLVALGFGVLAIGLWNATRPPVIVTATLDIPNLAPGTRILALHITDTHGGNPDMRRARLERIVAQANALKPDIILLTGDYHGGKLLDWPKSRLESALEPLAKLHAPLGVYASMGNHDPWHWTPIVLRRQPGPVLLINENRDIGPFTIAAVHSASHGGNLTKALANIPADRPVLLLAHEPETFLGQRPPRPLLMLSGHTHGGQIRLPLNIFPADWLVGTPPCRRGRCTVNGWTMFVSSGVGTSWAPMRFGVPPEMALLTLQASGKKSATDR